MTPLLRHFEPVASAKSSRRTILKFAAGAWAASWTQWARAAAQPGRNGKARSVPAVGGAINYEVTTSGRRTLPASQAPKCA